MNITGKGMKFRWLNNAGFEMELSSGKHLLVDPWLDEAQVYPISINEIERADYVLLTHTHVPFRQYRTDPEALPTGSYFCGGSVCGSIV